MGEAATVTPPPASTSAPPAAATPTPSAGASLASVPSGAWFSDFKNDEVKTYVSQKGFKTVEDMAVSYQNLEKLKGVPEDRLLRLPEKLDGDEIRPIFERLGLPKEPKGYELPRDQNTDLKFTDAAEAAFHKNNITKAQAQGLTAWFNELSKNNFEANQKNIQTMRATDEEKLKSEWGANYDKNFNIAKEGARVLGLDLKALDFLEMAQGREALYKGLQKIGAQVGESNFVDGKPAGTVVPKTPEQAASEIKDLMQDKKFGKQLLRGDVEATKRWNELNKIAAPGEIQII